METSVGITEYLAEHFGISGIIKQRYSDFIVNEVDLDDGIVHLTSMDYEESYTCVSDITEQVLSDEQLEKINEVDLKVTAECVISVSDDKPTRAKIHDFIKKVYPALNSTTKEVDGLKCILVDRKPKRKEKFCGTYCKFVLYKENKSTMEAIEYISKLLRVKSSLFSFAGTKDKRAITTQEVTAYRMHPTRFIHLNKALKNVALGNFRFCETPLKLGDLNGNYFQIVLRNLVDPHEMVNNYMSLLKEKGFINYFGMQRFGITEICNSEIGRYILKSDWKAAIEAILRPRHEDNELLIECRKVWKDSHDPVKALVALKHYSCIERKLLQGLEQYSERNYVAALAMIPRNMRLMYLHSYQSLIWNKVVSMRISNFKDAVLLGDLYQKDGSMEVDVVTEENISNINICDVVHPLPGFDVNYPTNEMKTWYDDILKVDDLDSSNFKHRIRDYSLPGSYRKIIVRPSVCRWSVERYDDYQIPLLSTDMDHLKGGSPNNPSAEGRLKALKIEMQLPTSSYATMAIREVVRQDTSSLHQTTLNVN